MIRPRAICGAVWAMPRPERPTSEAQAVREAAGQIGAGRSVQCVAAAIARRVVDDLMAFMDETDPMSAALREAQQQMLPSPFTTLATDPTIDTARDVFDRRRRAFDARGCRQWMPEEWAADQRRIGEEVTALLTSRYAKHLRRK